MRKFLVVQEYKSRMESLNRPGAAPLPAEKKYEARREADRLAGQVQALIQLQAKRSALLLKLEDSCMSMSAPTTTAPEEGSPVSGPNSLTEEDTMEEDEAHSSGVDMIDPIILHNGEPTLLPEVTDAKDVREAELRWLAMNTV